MNLSSDIYHNIRKKVRTPLTGQSYFKVNNKVITIVFDKLYRGVDDLLPLEIKRRNKFV